MTEKSLKKVSLYTDGACLGNPGPGGWAAILKYNNKKLEISGADKWTTNNKMELLAVIKGLEKLRYPCDVTIVTDSQYVMKGITQWIHRWQKNGWKTANKNDVKNKDLWLALLEETEKHMVSWQWIRGHSGHSENERCDELAKKAIDDREK
jgi:ribonuclease HI